MQVLDGPPPPPASAAAPLHDYMDASRDQKPDEPVVLTTHAGQQTAAASTHTPPGSSCNMGLSVVPENRF